MISLMQGSLVLTCVVESHQNGTAFCRVTEVEDEGFDRKASEDTELYLFPEFQTRPELLNMTEEEFLAEYPVGKAFRVAYNVMPIAGRPRTPSK